MSVFMALLNLYWSSSKVQLDTQAVIKLSEAYLLT